MSVYFLRVGSHTLVRFHLSGKTPNTIELHYYSAKILLVLLPPPLGQEGRHNHKLSGTSILETVLVSTATSCG